MEFKIFSKLYDEAKNYGDIDMYVAERGWQEWMDKYSQDSDVSVIADILHSIFELSKMDIKQLRTSLGLTFNAFSSIYSVPSRTVQDWEYGKNKTPEYMKKLVAYTIFIGRLEHEQD